jgi:hypothetical protein
MTYKRGAIFTFHQTRFGESEEIGMCAVGVPGLDVLPHVEEGAQFPQLSGGEVAMYAVIGQTLVAGGPHGKLESLAIVQHGDQHKVRMLFAAKGLETRG